MHKHLLSTTLLPALLFQNAEALPITPAPTTTTSTTPMPKECRLCFVSFCLFTQMAPKRVLMPLPDYGFDVTETSVAWKVFTRAGLQVTFTTLSGEAGGADKTLLSGVLESKELFHVIQRFFETSRPVGAICHGVLLAARAGVLDGKKTTVLPKYMERGAFFSTWWKLGRHYRTYDEYTEDEVRRLAPSAQIHIGPTTLFSRGTDACDENTFVVVDQRYCSGRWPGDAWALAKTLTNMLMPADEGAAKTFWGTSSLTSTDQTVLVTELRA